MPKTVVQSYSEALGRELSQLEQVEQVDVSGLELAAQQADSALEQHRSAAARAPQSFGPLALQHNQAQRQQTDALTREASARRGALSQAMAAKKPQRIAEIRQLLGAGASAKDAKAQCDASAQQIGTLLAERTRKAQALADRRERIAELQAERAQAIAGAADNVDARAVGARCIGIDGELEVHAEVIQTAETRLFAIDREIAAVREAFEKHAKTYRVASFYHALLEDQAIAAADAPRRIELAARAQRARHDLPEAEIDTLAVDRRATELDVELPTLPLVLPLQQHSAVPVANAAAAAA